MSAATAYHVRIWDDTTSPRTLRLESEAEALLAYDAAVRAGFQATAEKVAVGHTAPVGSRA